MPFLWAALYVFRWAFHVAAVFSLLVALWLVTQAGDTEKALQLGIGAAVLIGLGFWGRVILERPV